MSFPIRNVHEITSRFPFCISPSRHLEMFLTEKKGLVIYGKIALQINALINARTSGIMLDIAAFTLYQSVKQFDQSRKKSSTRSLILRFLSIGTFQSGINLSAKPGSYFVHVPKKVIREHKIINTPFLGVQPKY